MLRAHFLGVKNFKSRNLGLGKRSTKLNFIYQWGHWELHLNLYLTFSRYFKAIYSTLDMTLKSIFWYKNNFDKTIIFPLTWHSVYLFVHHNFRQLNIYSEDPELHIRWLAVLEVGQTYLLKLAQYLNQILTNTTISYDPNMIHFERCMLIQCSLMVHQHQNVTFNHRL